MILMDYSDTIIFRRYLNVLTYDQVIINSDRYVKDLIINTDYSTPGK